MYPIRLNECVQLLSPNSIDKAIQCTNLLVLDYPDEPNAVNYRGIAYYMKQEYDLALNDFNKAISLSKKDPVLYYNRSSVFFARGKYDDALPDLDKAISLDKKYADAYLQRGVVYFNKAQYDKALQDANQSIKLNSKNAGAYKVRADIYVTQNKFGDALQDCYQAISINPNFSEVYELRAFIYFYTGKYDLAMADFNKATEMNPQLVFSYIGRGMANWINGFKDSAVADLQRAVSVSPKASSAYFHLAYFMDEMGDKQKAEVYFSRAQSLEPGIIQRQQQYIMRPTAERSKAYYKNIINSAAKYLKTGIASEKAVLPADEKKPSMIIDELQIDPVHPIKGEKFDIIIKYTVTDTEQATSQIQVNFSFKILQDSKVVFDSESITLESMNGTQNTRTQHMNPASKKGTFVVEVNLKYKDKTTTKTIGFTID